MQHNRTFHDEPYTSRKLCIEVVPKTLWHKNLHTNLDRKEWDRVRRSIYRKYDYTCSVCGNRNTTMHAHEVWAYDDEKQIQTLVDIVCLCSLCDRVKHIGLTQILAVQGKVSWRETVEHYCRINQCDEATFNADHRMALHVHAIRSKFEWQQEIGDYSRFLV